MADIDLVSAVEQASDLDLKLIADRIDQLEAERRGIDARIASLRQIRDVIQVRLHGPSPKKQRQPRKTATDNGQPADEPEHKLIADRVLSLLNRSGPLDRMGICRRLHLNEASLNMSLSKQRAQAMFRTLQDGRIAPADWKDVGEG